MVEGNPNMSLTIHFLLLFEYPGVENNGGEEGNKLFYLIEDF